MHGTRYIPWLIWNWLTYVFTLFWTIAGPPDQRYHMDSELWQRPWCNSCLALRAMCADGRWYEYLMLMYMTFMFRMQLSFSLYIFLQYKSAVKNLILFGSGFLGEDHGVVARRRERCVRAQRRRKSRCKFQELSRKCRDPPQRGHFLFGLLDLAPARHKQFS